MDIFCDPVSNIPIKIVHVPGPCHSHMTPEMELQSFVLLCIFAALCLHCYVIIDRRNKKRKRWRNDKFVTG